MANTIIINQAYDHVFLKVSVNNLMALTDDASKVPLMIEGVYYFAQLGMKFKWLDKEIITPDCTCSGTRTIWNYRVRCWAENIQGGEYPFNKVETFVLTFTDENQFEETVELTRHPVRESVLDEATFYTIDNSIPSSERTDLENKRWTT